MSGNPQHLAHAEQLLALLRSDFGLPRETRTVIAVAGESGSGKSVTAANLAAVLRAAGVGTAIIHQDNYFVRPPHTNHEYRLQVNLASVGPREVQLDLIQSQIAAFRAGAADVSAPVVNYPENRFDTQVLDFSLAQMLVVEGTYALLLDDTDIRIFLTATWEDTDERRRERNRDIDVPIIATILGMEHEIISRQRARADIIIDRDFRIMLPG